MNEEISEQIKYWQTRIEYWRKKFDKARDQVDEARKEASHWRLLSISLRTELEEAKAEERDDKPKLVELEVGDIVRIVRQSKVFNTHINNVGECARIEEVNYALGYVDVRTLGEHIGQGAVDIDCVELIATKRAKKREKGVGLCDCPGCVSNRMLRGTAHGGCGD